MPRPKNPLESRPRVENPATPSKAKDIVDAMFAAGRRQGIDMDVVADKIVAQFGGLDDFASTLHDEYTKAKPGSVVRQRILAMIHEILRRTSENRQARGLNLESASTEDLERVLDDYLKQRGFLASQ